MEVNNSVCVSKLTRYNQGIIFEFDEDDEDNEDDIENNNEMENETNT